MPNILTGNILASAPTQVSVGVSSAQLVAFNAQRVGIVVTNISTGTVYLGIGASNAAVVGSGITLMANGGSWSMDEYTYTLEQINAISHAAQSAVAVQEFVNRA